MTYRAPGVRIREVSAASLVQNPGGFNVTAIVGTGAPTVPIENLIVARAAGDIDDLTGFSAGEVASVSSVGEIPGFAQFVIGTDVQLINGYQLQWLTGNRPGVGADYYVDGARNKVAADYEPMRQFDIDDVRKQAGPELEGGLVNTLTLAALLELEARGSVGGGIIMVQAEDGTTGKFIEAIDKLETEEVDTIIVTGVTNSQVRNWLIQHVQKMSSDEEKKERTTYIAPDSLTADVSTIGDLAEAILDDRVCLIAPPAIGVQVTDSETQELTRIVVSSVFAGANISGIESNPNNDAATPMLRKRLSARIDLNGFKYLKKEKNFLASKGAFVLEQDPVTGFVSVFDAITTDRTTVDREERSVRRIKDRIRKDVRTVIERQFIGQKNLPDQLNSIEMQTSKILDSFVDAQILRNARNIKARQGADPREVLLTFEILPVFPLKWVSITFTVSAS